MSGANQDAGATVSHTADPDAPFVPSPVDILVVRAMLRKSRALPYEIANRIIEFAEYWTSSHTSISYRNPDTGAERSFGQDANKFLIRTPPVGFRHPPTARYTTDDKIPPAPLSSELETQGFERFLGAFAPTLVHPVRKVVFTIQSHDQGWATGERNRGYHNSWTWFEAGLERFDPSATCADEQGGRTCKHRPLDEPDHALAYCKLRPIHPAPETKDNGDTALGHKLLHDHALMIQCNKIADRKALTHTVTWSWSDDTHPDSPGADDLVAQGRGQATGTGEFVRGLKVGDVVSVWAKARFPGWANYVRSVAVDVYWAV